MRSEGDDWIRLRLEKGDLAIMPAGIYHRFTTDEKNVSFCNETAEKEENDADNEGNSTQRP